MATHSNYVPDRKGNTITYRKKQFRIARKVLWAFIAILAVLIAVVR